jgi:hypothetical protein
MSNFNLISGIATIRRYLDQVLKACIPRQGCIGRIFCINAQSDTKRLNSIEDFYLSLPSIFMLLFLELLDVLMSSRVIYR